VLRPRRTGHRGGHRRQWPSGGCGERRGGVAGGDDGVGARYHHARLQLILNI
jgi:hypothetical protein